jgi:hypothetical protein
VFAPKRIRPMLLFLASLSVSLLAMLVVPTILRSPTRDTRKNNVFPRVALGVHDEVLLTLVVDRNCMYSASDSLSNAVRSLLSLTKAARRAGSGIVLRTRLVVLDQWTDTSDLTSAWRSEFDEVSYGGHWTSTALLSTINGDTSARLATPSLIVSRAKLVQGRRLAERQDQTVLRFAAGVRQIHATLNDVGPSLTRSSVPE